MTQKGLQVNQTGLTLCDPPDPSVPRVFSTFPKPRSPGLPPLCFFVRVSFNHASRLHYGGGTYTSTTYVVPVLGQSATPVFTCQTKPTVGMDPRTPIGRRWDEHDDRRSYASRPPAPTTTLATLTDCKPTHTYIPSYHCHQPSSLFQPHLTLPHLTLLPVSSTNAQPVLPLFSLLSSFAFR